VLNEGNPPDQPFPELQKSISHPGREEHSSAEDEDLMGKE
jgi:hypothetical protein